MLFHALARELLAQELSLEWLDLWPNLVKPQAPYERFEMMTKYARFHRHLGGLVVDLDVSSHEISPELGNRRHLRLSLLLHLLSAECVLE
jgi:hypothetical protein